MANLVFKIAGITTQGTNTKVRFTNDMVRRIKQFSKGSASRIDFIELPTEMTKVDALNYLKSHPDFQSPADQSTISDAIEDRKSAPAKREVKVKVVKAKPSIESIKARTKKKVTAESILAIIKAQSESESV